MTPGIELPAERSQQELIRGKLEHHWAMDTAAAVEFSEGLSESECAHIDSTLLEIESQWGAVEARDKSREEIGKIFSGESDKQLIILGPCSLDAETDYSALFDHLEELQATHPDAVIAFRGNGAKPRTGSGWRGLKTSTNLHEREALITVYQEAFRRKIPIITEITDSNELGSLAPYLSGAWLGARDMTSTALRAAFAAIHIPVAIKNGLDGEPGAVKNAMNAIKSNTKLNDGSGVNLGALGATPSHRGIPTGVLPVGVGNNKVAIIARGYELPTGMSERRRNKKALQHLGKMCLLAAEENSVVLLDGSHGVPPMFGIERSDGNRFLKVMHKIIKAAREGKIVHADRVKGVVGEVGTEVGKTDKNMIATHDSMAEVSTMIYDVAELQHIDGKNLAMGRRILNKVMGYNTL